VKLFKHPFMKIIALLLGVCLFAFAGQAMGEDEEEDGGTIVFTKPVKAVIFEHKIHMEMGMECDSCHEDIFEMATGTAEENDDFTMKSLYAGKYCGACHDGDTAFASNTRCTACHIGVRGYQRMNGESPDAKGHGGGHE
jgi:c(7)-type cytochrome triheme protein